MNEWMVNLIQSSCVNVKIAWGREPRLVFMLFISFNEKITFLLVGTVDNERLNIIWRDCFKVYNIII